MTLAAAPHPMSVFRYLKTAWRLYIASDNAATLTVNPIASQPAANPLTVAGTFVFDRSYVFPANIYCNIYVGGVLKGGGLVGTAMTFSGSYSTTYPGGAPLIPGAAHVDVFLSAGQSQAGADFTLT